MIRWSYTIESIYGWGNPKSAQQSTAGWLSQFQIFEPGWQILMAHGLATGWFEKVDGANQDHHQSRDRLNFENVPAYAEKNWGGAFPKQWFWIQCNAFVDHPDLSLTCGGGIRKVLGLEESVGMVGIHYQGEFYEFTPWTAKLSWQVLAWGEWQVLAKGANFEIELIGKSSDIGVIVRVPTETGLKLFCRDTTKGDLQVNFWRTKGRSRSLIFSAHSQQAGLEIGGDWSGQKSWCK
jgi:tocopherol cyclase